MAGWRSYILEKLGSGSARLVVAEDPDELLYDEGIQAALNERGYGFLVYDDPIAFRYAYASDFRTSSGEPSSLLIRAPKAGFNALPYDILQQSTYVRFVLNDLFPTLHYATLADLGRDWLDALWRAQRDPKAPSLGARDTKLFVLRHVFEIDPAAIHTVEDLLRVLLRRHYRGQQVPTAFDDYLIDLLSTRPAYEGWPLRQIVPDREAFFLFLQERWPLFVDRAVGIDARNEPGAGVHDHQASDYAIAGPAALPFQHEDIRVYIDNLFLEGFLQPIEPPGPVDPGAWVGVGLNIDPERDRLRRADHLLGVLDDDLPDTDAHHKEWLSYAPRWAELVALRAQSALPLPQETAYSALEKQVDERFENWVVARYDGLRTQSPLPPVMLHHVPRYLRLQGKANRKVALLLIDGLSLDQWVTLSRALDASQSPLRFHEGAVFAWLPTLTAVSRQALFTGHPPYDFGRSIGRTDRDEAGWQQFWQEQGLQKRQVRYLNVSGNPSDLDLVRGIAEDASVRAFGLVIRKVDEIIHGMKLGSVGMHNQLRLWAQEPFLGPLVDLLLRAGYTIYLTADHGNVEAAGCGRPAGGLKAMERGERVRVYESRLARSEAASGVPDAIAWTPAGLPDGYETLFAAPRKAFTQAGKRVVTHGGISLEEVIVPFIHIHT